MNRKLFAVALVLLLSLAVFVSPARAHAELLRSIPEANANLQRSPAQIELYLSEAIEPSFSSITVLDSSGRQVDNADSRVDPLDPTHLTVSVSSLPDGVYTVSWKVLSTVDGHVTAGAFPFAVGEVSAEALAAAEQRSQRVSLSVLEIISRWLTFLSATALAGGTFFVLVVWQPMYQLTKAEFGKVAFAAPWRRLGAMAILALLFASGLGLLVQAGKAAGLEIAPPWHSAAANLLFNTRYGALWLARAALTFALAGLLPEAKTTRDRWIAFGLALLVLLTISFGSHAAAQPQPVLPVLADWLHLVGASVWVGGLTHFVTGMWLARQFEPAFRTRLTARLIPRFSALALVSVGVLTLTGLYASILHIGSFDLLFNSFYGRALLIKLVIALPMIGLGAVNLLGITPRMKKAAEVDGDGSLVSRFRNIITSEITLGTALLLSVGILTAVPPAQTGASAPVIQNTGAADDLSLDFEITPGRVGINTFTLTVLSGGQPVTGAKEVALRFTPAGGKVPPSEAILTEQENGRYSIKGSYLSLPDDWQVQAVVRREGQFDAYVNFNLSLGASGTGPQFPWHNLTGGLLFLSALVYLFAFSTLGQTQAQLIGFGIAPALALAVASVFVFYQTPATQNAATVPVNPVPPNQASVTSGETLYQTNCVPCHGPAGKGDGPIGLTLSPRPADLTIHTVPGVHPDGQLFLWISDGFPGSVMPAFRTSLSEEERWHLVNYIRTLSPSPTLAP